MKYSLINKEKQGITYLTSPQLTEEKSIFICFTTRLGGYSKSSFDGLNLGLHVNDNKEIVLKNRQKLAKVLGVEFSKFTCAKQVHSNNVCNVSEAEIGKGGTNFDNAIKNTDSLITKLINVPLILFFADCLPLIIVNPNIMQIAVVHAGWKGAWEGIVDNTVKELIKDGLAQDLIAFIGPYIGPCCYKVSRDRIKLFQKKFPFVKGPSLDLGQVIKTQLKEFGINQIYSVAECTKCNVDKYFSYRESSITGRHAALAVIRG